MPTTQDRRRIRPIQVLLADDHPIYAEALALVLGCDDRVEVVGRAEDGIEAVELALELRPDVVLMDVHMPRRDGIEATRLLRTALPAVRVVMLSSSSAAEDLARAHGAGACSYLSKEADSAAIAGEIVRAAGGLSARRAA